MNSIPIVTQLDIFEPCQETERCRRGGLELRLRNLRGVQPRIIRGWRAKTGGYAMKKTSTRGRTYGEQRDDSRRLTRTRSAAFARPAARAPRAAMPPRPREA